MKGLDRYKGFGLRKEWLHRFLEFGSSWEEGAPLGNRQVEGMRRWLADAGLMAHHALTPLGDRLIASGSADDPSLWLLIWTNLSYHAPVVTWYAYSIPPGLYTKTWLVDLLAHSRGTTVPNRTHLNAVNALVELLAKTPLGDQYGLGIVKREGKTMTIRKTEAPRAIPNAALLYAIAAYNEEHDGMQVIPLEQLCSLDPRSPCRLFSLADEVFVERCLSLARCYPQWIQLQTIEGDSALWLSAEFDRLVAADEVLGRYEPLPQPVPQPTERPSAPIDEQPTKLSAFSWTVRQEPVAIKKLDRSAFIHNETGIPIAIRPFFSLEKVTPGERRPISLLYRGKYYEATLRTDIQHTPRTRLEWKTDFADLLHSTFPRWYDHYVRAGADSADGPELRFRASAKCDIYYVDLVEGNTIHSGGTTPAH